MFYNKINNSKIKIYRVILNCFLVLVYMSSYSGCTTTGLYSVPPGDLKTGSTAEIKKIELKNGTVIDCAGKLIRIEREADSSLVYVILTDEPVKTTSGGDQKAVKSGNVRIPEKDIRALTLENTGSNSTTTGLAVGGFLVILALIIALIAVGNSMNFGVGH